jgi:hypothetical protein
MMKYVCLKRKEKIEISREVEVEGEWVEGMEIILFRTGRSV